MAYIGVDLIGPLPETAMGNKYVMTVSFLFSKWPEATALPNKSAIGVAEFLFKCFTRHGCCKVKISDQGREFVNKVLQRVLCITCDCGLPSVSLDVFLKFSYRCLSLFVGYIFVISLNACVPEVLSCARGRA